MNYISIELIFPPHKLEVTNLVDEWNHWMETFENLTKKRMIYKEQPVYIYQGPGYFFAELRFWSVFCDFGESVECNILGQVIEKCYDGNLREKRLQRGYPDIAW